MFKHIVTAPASESASQFVERLPLNALLVERGTMLNDKGDLLVFATFTYTPEEDHTEW